MVEYRVRDFRRPARGSATTHAIVLRDLALSPGFERRYC